MIWIYSIAVLGILGLILGFGLAFASKKFSVWEDPLIKEIEESLPGANCGGCGFAGCHSYAEAVAAGKADISLCKPGGEKVAKEIARITGQQVKMKEPEVSQRYCNGGRNEAKVKSEYHGIETCKAASLLNNGYKECSYSCLGFGDCIKVCPANAISLDENSLPQIDKNRCIGCARCVQVCPRNVLKMVPKKARVHVRCSSHDPANKVMKSCTVGCIACRQCEKACPAGAIKIIDNLAVIDYSKCVSCGKCVQACPKKIIVQEPLPKNKSAKKQEEKKEAQEEEKKE